MRNLTKTLAVVSLLVPTCAQPLGIGDIKLHSSLNQKLNAEIKLVLSPGEKASDIRVQLAPPEKFDEADVPWSYFLPKIKFKTVVRSNGSAIVKLSSNEALQEPFLDFLLEVSWPKGDLYREFTVLVDPPVSYQQPIIPVVQTAQQKRQKRSSQKTQLAKAKTVSAQVENNVSEYGPTTRKDTLWKIAEKVKPSNDISIEQMMMALYAANHRAFYKRNVNALKSGRTLDIPNRDDILKLSRKRAATLFKQQNLAWNNSLNTASPKKPESSEKITAENQLELIAPVETEVPENVTISSKAKPKSSVPDKVESNTIAVKPENAADTGASQATQVSNLEMQARLDKLEQQLIAMQKLLSLKNEQLAALQNQHQPSNNRKVISENSSETLPLAVADTKTSVQQTKAKPKPETKPKSQVVAKHQTTPVPVAKTENSFFAEAYYFIVGGLGVLILGLLGWLWWRKQQNEDESDLESMFASSSEIRMPDSEDISVSDLEKDPAYDVGTVGESSFLSEFTPSDFDAFETDQSEVDPISEADVYLAYGRYQQAEDLIRQALEDQPERKECKLKLLEIFYANEKKEAFEQYTRELVQSGMRSDPVFWAKVLDMANEIIPDSEVLTDPSDGKSTDFAQEKDDSDQLNGQSDQEDTRFEDNDEHKTSELDDFEIEEADFKLDGNESDIPDLDIDLNTYSSAGNSSEDQPDNKTTSSEQLESIDFDLDTLSATDIDQSSEEKIGKYDKEGNSTSASNADLNGKHLESFNFSLDSEPTENKVAEVTEKKPSANEEDEFEFDFNFDFDEVSLSEDGSSPEEKSAVSDLTDMDEYETKIDLAKAYIDMGDMDAAKSLAEEVLEKGDDPQKKSARALLDHFQ